jgi:PAS domain S-box-containing protein
MEIYFNEIFMLASKHFFKEFKGAGGSQKQMAKELCVTKSYISAVMNGSRTASIILFEKIALMLSGKPLDEFLAVGRRIKKGLPPLLQEEKPFLDSPEELISKLTYYIVDHHRMKRALEDEQWLFREAINLVDYGIVIVSIDRKVLAYNKAYQEIFGYPEEILATRDMRAYVRFGRNQMANLEKFDREIQEAFETVTPTSHYVELKDGRIIKRDTFPLYRDGNLVGRIGHLTDVTLTKKEATN